MTYPDAIFGVFMDGLLEVNGKPGFAGTFPWDDGSHQFLSSEMSQLQAGPCRFSHSAMSKVRTLVFQTL